MKLPGRGYGDGRSIAAGGYGKGLLTQILNASGRSCWMRYVRDIAITDAMLISCSIAEDDHAEWASGSTFNAGERCIQSANHYIYESIGDGNTGHDPSADTYSAVGVGTYWLRIGKTNRWRAFDDLVSTKAEAANSITYTLAPGRSDAVVLFGVEAKSVTITQYAGTKYVYRRTKKMSGSDFAEQVQFSDLRLSGNLNVVITILSPGGTAKVGEIVVGQLKVIGETQWDGRRRIRDRSQKKETAPGIMQLVPGNYYKQREVSAAIPMSRVDEITRFMEAERATLGAWLISDLYNEDILYGWLNDWTITTGRGVHGNVLSAQLESLV